MQLEVGSSVTPLTMQLIWLATKIIHFALPRRGQETVFSLRVLLEGLQLFRLRRSVIMCTSTGRFCRPP